MFERTYLFNPFMLQTSDDEELSKEINRLAGLYREADLPYDIVYDINLESDLLTIYGEFIARFQESADLLKIEADNRRDKAIYTLRKDWVSMNDDNPPDMS